MSAKKDEILRALAELGQAASTDVKNHLGLDHHNNIAATLATMERNGFVTCVGTKVVMIDRRSAPHNGRSLKHKVPVHVRVYAIKEK